MRGWKKIFHANGNQKKAGVEILIPDKTDFKIKTITGTSLVAQWLGICLPSRRHRFNPWSGKIPHATEQLILCATTTEPVL